MTGLAKILPFGVGHHMMPTLGDFSSDLSLAGQEVPSENYQSSGAFCVALPFLHLFCCLVDAVIAAAELMMAIEVPITQK